MLSGIGDAGSDLGIGGVGEVGGLHLLREEFLVDETIQNGAAVIVGELREGSVGEQSFVAECFVPVALEDDVSVHRRDDAVDDLGRAVLSREPQGREHECQRDLGHRSVGSECH